MLYPKNQTPKLDEALFKAPTSEYRGTPFWAWNCKLEGEELKWQIDVLEQMGFGGFHMHVRTGMDTPYLTDEYMDRVEDCVEHARGKEMLAWLYDEDRWPSGPAGGIVTKEEKYRQRSLMFTVNPYEDDLPPEANGVDMSARISRPKRGYLLAKFDIKLNLDGTLASYRRIGKNEAAEGTAWYAYVETPSPNTWWNNQTYVNTLDREAIQRFVEVTHERYRQRFAGDFGGVIPAIFTDEPQFSRKRTLPFAESQKDVTLPWSDDLEDTFVAAYGDSLVEHIPELIWDLPDEVRSLTRYHYHDHVAERFASAFADTVGGWCRENGILLTGHMMAEPTLMSQTGALGEAMRSYRSFGLPGIDMLCALFEYTTAKQAQSATHQYGYPGVMSELYGVTGWDFDFRGHKLHGDWQAALGVTVRVPHLSWVSMAGEAKRDYPASIHYQSPWYGEYAYVEDHFARVNTAMTRGKPIVRVGVIHPVESYWLHWGPSEQTALARDQMDESFQNITKWLLFGSVDFDFIAESLLPDLCPKASAPLQVGEMAYDVILVPGCETLRETTLARLEAFAAAGGKLVFLGSAPTLIDAKPDNRGAALAARTALLPFSRSAVLGAVDAVREVEIRNDTGALSDNLLHQIRQDGDDRWLFVAHGTEPYNKDVSRRQGVRITLTGNWTPTLYDTTTGEIKPMPYKTANGKTIIETALYDYDSLLLKLSPAAEGASYAAPVAEKVTAKPIAVPNALPYTLSEPNVLVLDMAEFALDDDADYAPAEELLRADNVCRKRLGWPLRGGRITQPWCIEPEPIEHQIRLRFTFRSTIPLRNALLALEDAEDAKIILDGATVPSVVVGWYVDKSIKKVALPPIEAGEHKLEVILPFGRRTNVEWCYLLGDFGVSLRGTEATVIAPADKLAFGNILPQGLPFYGGEVTYCLDFISNGGKVSLRVPHYKAAVLSVAVDGEKVATLAYPPYKLDLGRLSAGSHKLEITAYISRQNAFGPLHLSDMRVTWIGPSAWRSTGDSWTYAYNLYPEGITSAVELTEEE
ncbi:MAG: hypothetical protein IKD37_07490 [Clostridia bacterium]|nr:hypothetical protein [Clostridia bacterium]